MCKSTFKPSVYCEKCWRYLRESDGPEVEYGDDYEAAIEWITCDRCLEREANPGKIVGGQPAVCLQCREPFEATRQGQKFCSASCRARAWRARRLVVAP
jgi:hypothetical protein